VNIPKVGFEDSAPDAGTGLIKFPEAKRLEPVLRGNIWELGFMVAVSSFGSDGFVGGAPNRGAWVVEVGGWAEKKDGVVVCIPEVNWCDGGAEKRSPVGWLGPGAPEIGDGFAGAVEVPGSPPKRLGTEFSGGFWVA
jgi:hypothetical protein